MKRDDPAGIDADLERRIAEFIAEQERLGLTRAAGIDEAEAAAPSKDDTLQAALDAFASQAEWNETTRKYEVTVPIMERAIAALTAQGLAITTTPSKDDTLRAAAQAVVDAWGREDYSLGWDGTKDYVDDLRAALAATDPTPTPDWRIAHEEAGGDGHTDEDWTDPTPEPEPTST